MNIDVRSKNIDLTEGVHTYLNEKLEDCMHAFGDMNLDPVQIDIELERTTKHHKKGDNLFRAEANVSVPGDMLRTEETGSTIEAAIDMMKDELTRDIRKWREKKIDQSRKGAREAKRRLRGDDR